jgi:hypothetical protein
MNDKPKRYGFRYSLRTLLVFVTIASAGLGWLGVKVRAKQREREAVKPIHELGCVVGYDYHFDLDDRTINSPTPPGPAWLRKLLGDDVFANVAVMYFGPTATDEDFRTLPMLDQLKGLNLRDTQFTDAGLIHFTRLSKLKELDLGGTQVTDVGMVHLAGLSELKWLSLNETRVTNAGLVHLKGLTKLQVLTLFDTQATDTGVQELQRALPNLKIDR